MPDNYTSQVYRAMQAAYGSKGFDTPEGEFTEYLQTNPEYQAQIHNAMSSFYGEKGFDSSLEDFQTYFIPQEETPSFEDEEKRGAVASLIQSGKEFGSKMIPALGLSGLSLVNETLEDWMYDEEGKAKLKDEKLDILAELRTVDSQWSEDEINAAAQQVEKFKDQPFAPMSIDAVNASKRLKDSADYTGIATKLSDIYNIETGEFQPENIGSFVGYGLGQLVPQYALMYATAGLSALPMGVGEAVDGQIDAFENTGLTVEEVFLEDKFRVSDAWAEGLTIGALDKFSFGKMGGGAATVKTLKDVMKKSLEAGIWELLTESAQEAIGALGGEAATREDGAIISKQSWDKVRDTMHDPNFWYDRVLSAGVQGLLGSTVSTSITQSVAAIANNMSAETKQDVKNFAGEMNIEVPEGDLGTEQLTNEEKLTRAENVKLNESIDQLAVENGTKLQTGQIEESLDAAASRIADATKEITETPKPKAKETKGDKVVDETKPKYKEKTKPVEKVEKPKPTKVEKTKPAPTKEKAKVQEPATVPPKKPVVQKEKVSKGGLTEKVMKAGKIVEAVKPEKKSEAQIVEEEVAKADKDEKAAKINLENKAHAVVTKNTSESKQNKVGRLKKIANKAKGKVGETAIPNIQKRIDILENEIRETEEHSKHLAEQKAKKAAEKVEAEKEVVAPTRKGAKYVGQNEAGQDIFETPKGTRTIVDKKGQIVKTQSERTKHTPTELKNRKEVRNANNSKVTAFQKKMVEVQQRVIGYTAKVKSTKDAGTKALYQSALKEAQAESDALTKELKDWRKDPDQNRDEDKKSGLTFTDDKKVETAIAAAKEKAKLTPKKALPKKKVGRQKETLSDKERRGTLPSEQKRVEQATKDVGKLLGMLNDRSKLNANERTDVDDVHARASEKQQRQIQEALKRVEERGKEQAKKDAMEDFDNLVKGEDIDFDNFDDYHIPQTEGIEDFLGGSMKTENATKVKNASELVTRMKGGKIGSVVARVTAQLLDKLNTLRVKYNLPAIEFYVADDIIVTKKGKSKSVDGLHATSNRRTGIIITEAGLTNSHTLAHELMHAFHAIFNGMTQELANTKGAQSLVKVGKQFDADIQNIFKATKKEWNLMLDDYFKGEMKNTELGDILDTMVESGYNLTDLYGFQNHHEFLAEAMSDGLFASVLNNMRVEGGTRLQQNETVWRRLVNAIMDTVTLLGLTRPNTVLSEVVASMENIDLAEQAESTRIFKGMKFKNQYKEKADARFAAIQEAILSRITSVEGIQTIVDKINKKLPKGKQITKREVGKITTLAKKGAHTKMVDEVIDKLKKLTNPQNFIAAKGKPDIIKGKKADADTIRLMEQTHEKLTMVHTEKSDKAALKRLKEYNVRMLNGEELSVEDMLDLELTRYELAHMSSLEDTKTLHTELKDTLKRGALARKQWLNQRRVARQRVTTLGLEQLLEGVELTQKNYLAAKKKMTPQKENGIWKNFIIGLETKTKNWGKGNESFHSLLDLMGGKQKGTGMMKTFFNTMFGKPERQAFIKKHKLEKKWNDEVMAKIDELFGEQFATKGLKFNLKNPFNKALEFLGDERYAITYISEEGSNRAGEEITETYSLDQLANIWVWSKQLDTESSFIQHGYGADFLNQVDALLNKNPKVKELAEWMLNDFYPNKYNEINAIYRERTGHDLPQVDFYSPLVYDYQKSVDDAGVALDTYHPVTSTLRSFALKRQANRQKLDFSTGLLSNANRHIENASHFVAYDKFVSDLRSFFKNSDVEKALEMRFGDRMNKVMDTYIEAFAQENVFRSFLHSTIDRLRANLVTTFLGVNPTIYFKQLTSSIAYSAHMPTGSKKTWGEDQIAALVPKSKMAKESAKYRNLIQNHDVFVARKKRGQRTIGEAFQSMMGSRLFGEATGGGVYQKMQLWMMNMVKAGDMGAIAHGGWPVLRAKHLMLMENGMAEKPALELAFEEFIDTTLSAQQSTATADLSNIQLDNNSIVRLFTAFTTTPMQYLRNTKASYRALKRNDWVRTRAGRKAGLQLAMYSVILPVFFEMVSQAGNIFFADDEEEQEKLMSRLMYAPVNSLLTANHLLGGIVNTAIKAATMGQDFGTYGGLVASASGLVTQGVKTMKKFSEGEEISEKEYIKLLDMITMLKSGMALGNAVELGMGLNDAIGGEGDWRNALGWSNYALGKKQVTTKKKTRVSPSRKPSARRRIIRRRLQRR